MTIRKRLTLWYAGLLTLIIILLGSIVFAVMRWSMITSIDNTLEETINQVEANSRLLPIPVPGVGTRIEVDLPELDFFRISGVEAQVWKIENGTPVLEDSTANLAHHELPLDAGAIGSVDARVYNTVNINGSLWRVRTSPIFNPQGHLIGNIQIAGSLEMVNKATQELFTVMLISCTLAILGSAVVSMWLSRRMLKPIEDITRAAGRIAETKDLSTRLPWHGPMDELGQLNSVFNQMMARLEHLFHVQQRFVADVSHELRTPLTAISGNLELIKRYGMDDESLDAITSETERMKRLVNDLLLLARADYGGLTVDLTPVELDSVMIDTFRQARGLVKDRQLELKMLHVEPLRVNGNIDRLKQMLLNLIDNAIKFTPDGGSITLSLRQQGKDALIEVQDTGKGISAEDLPHVFDRFYQSDPSRTHNDKGTGFGLGLSIAQWIVNAHHGAISVESELDKGTTFRICIPIFPVPPDPSHTEVTRTRLTALRRNRSEQEKNPLIS
jgi:two-component system, OmpR family, sensor kinase